ncbi:MAG: 30S ribosomal protein S20 [Patescibacteria group bacterium]
MPKIKSAKKALRQNVRRHNRNLERKKSLQTVLKQYKKMILEGKKDEAGKYLSQVYKALDKMAKTKFIKRGKADRLKSRLAKKLKN